MGSALAGSAAAFAVTAQPAGVEIDAPADRVHARDAHVERVAEAQAGAGALAAQDRALLVELPPLARALARALPGRLRAPAPALGARAPARGARRTRRRGRRAQQPDGQHALERRSERVWPAARVAVGVGEGDEGAGGDQPGDLACEARLGAALVEHALEREAARHVVGVALDHHRLALAFGAPRAELAHVLGARRVLAAAERGEQRAVADDVGVAADGRGEVAVGGGVQAGVAEVLRRVVGLLERAQHERAERLIRPWPLRRDVLIDQPRDLAEQLGGLRGGQRLGQRRRGHLQRGELVDEALDAGGLGALVHAVQAGHAALASSRATASLAAIMRCSIRRWDSVCAPARIAMNVAVRRRSELGLLGVEHERAAALALCAAARRRPARAACSGPATAPPARLGAGEDAVDLLVVQARVRADQRAVEGGAGRPRRRAARSSTVTAARSAPGTSEQASLESACGSIGSTAPGDVHAGCPPARLAVQR